MHTTFWLGNQNVRDHMVDHEMGKSMLKDLKEAVCVCVCVFWVCVCVCMC
jgi:hypothetical protein